jgi:hypothetical protein
MSYTEHALCALNVERDAQGMSPKVLNPKNAVPRRDPVKAWRSMECPRLSRPVRVS